MDAKAMRTRRDIGAMFLNAVIVFGLPDEREREWRSDLKRFVIENDQAMGLHDIIRGKEMDVVDQRAISPRGEFEKE